jgi:formylglycine-generating enzyme required for sulfatase activity
MNFRIFEVKFLAIILLLAVLFTMPSCSKKAPSNGKTLTSEKGKEKKGPLGRMMSFFSKKGLRDDPGLASGEIVATTRKGWSQPTPFGMVLVPGGSFIMGQADEDVTSSVANFNRRVTVVPFFMDDTEITNNEYRQFTTSLLRDSVSVLGEERIMAEYYPDTTV